MQHDHLGGPRRRPRSCSLCELWGFVPLSLALEYGLLGLREQTVSRQGNPVDQLNRLRRSHRPPLALPPPPELVPCPTCYGNGHCFMCASNGFVPVAFLVEFALTGLRRRRLSDYSDEEWTFAVRDLQAEHGIT